MPTDQRPGILFLSKGADAASTRYRALTFFPALEAAGFDPVHLSVRGGLGHDVQLLRAARHAAVTVVLRRTFSTPFRLALRSCARRLVFDLDDAIYRKPQEESSSRQRGFQAMVQRCDEVWAGNDVLADAARQAKPSGKVVVLPTTLDPTPYHPRSADQRDPKKLVWIGSSSTRPYLEAIMPQLEAAAARVPGLSLRIIADFTLESDRLPIEAKAWSSQTEVDDLATAGIGLGPLTDTPWTQGKCGFKLLQYMAAGLPCICDPVGANGHIVLDHQTGLHITPQRDWAQAIEALCHDPSLANAMGDAGRQRFDQTYSLPQISGRMIDRLNQLTNPTASG